MVPLIVILFLLFKLETLFLRFYYNEPIGRYGICSEFRKVVFKLYLFTILLCGRGKLLLLTMSPI